MRRDARIAVLKTLYSEEFNTNSSEEIFKKLLSSKKLKNEDREFARRLMKKTKEMKAIIDNNIKENLKNWSFKRLSKIDLNILRIAISETEEFPETPVKVIMDEAIEIAKVFGSSKSAKFVNGVLDSIFRKKGLL